MAELNPNQHLYLEANPKAHKDKVFLATNPKVQQEVKDYLVSNLLNRLVYLDLNLNLAFFKLLRRLHCSRIQHSQSQFFLLRKLEEEDFLINNSNSNLQEVDCLDLLSWRLDKDLELLLSHKVICSSRLSSNQLQLLDLQLFHNNNHQHYLGRILNNNKPNILLLVSLLLYLEFRTIKQWTNHISTKSQKLNTMMKNWKVSWTSFCSLLIQNQLWMPSDITFTIDLAYKWDNNSFKNFTKRIFHFNQSH